MQGPLASEVSQSSLNHLSSVVSERSPAPLPSPLIAALCGTGSLRLMFVNLVASSTSGTLLVESIQTQFHRSASLLSQLTPPPFMPLATPVPLALPFQRARTRRGRKGLGGSRQGDDRLCGGTLQTWS